jgi:hypothetical protein
MSGDRELSRLLAIIATISTTAATRRRGAAAGCGSVGYSVNAAATDL